MSYTLTKGGAVGAATEFLVAVYGSEAVPDSDVPQMAVSLQAQGQSLPLGANPNTIFGAVTNTTSLTDVARTLYLMQKTDQALLLRTKQPSSTYYPPGDSSMLDSSRIEGSKDVPQTLVVGIPTQHHQTLKVWGPNSLSAPIIGQGVAPKSPKLVLWGLQWAKGGQKQSQNGAKPPCSPCLGGPGHCP